MIKSPLVNPIARILRASMEFCFMVVFYAPWFDSKQKKAV